MGSKPINLSNLDLMFGCRILHQVDALAAVIEPMNQPEFCRMILDAVAGIWEQTKDTMLLKGLEGWLELALCDDLALRSYCERFLGLRPSGLDSGAFRTKFTSCVYTHMARNWAKYNTILSDLSDNVVLPSLLVAFLKYVIAKKDQLDQLESICIHTEVFKVILSVPDSNDSAECRKIMEDLVTIHVALQNQPGEKHRKSTILPSLKTKIADMLLEFGFNERTAYASGLIGSLLLLTEDITEIDGVLKKWIYRKPPPATDRKEFRLLHQISENWLDALQGTAHPVFMKALWFLLGYSYDTNAWVENHSFAGRVMEVMTTIARESQRCKIVVLADHLFEALAETFDNDSKTVPAARKKRDKNDVIIKNAIRQYLLPLLQTASDDVVRDIYAKHINVILRFLDEQEESHPSNEAKRLTRATCCFNLLQVCFERVEAKDINGEGGAIVAAIPNGGGTYFTRTLFPKGQSARSFMGRPNRTDGERLDMLRLEYRQAAHAWILAYFVKTQSKARVYTTHLLNSSNDKAFKWEYIIDTERKYHFKTSLDAPFVRKTIADLSSAKFQGERSQAKYMSTQFLRNSSLAVSQPSKPSVKSSRAASQVASQVFKLSNQRLSSQVEPQAAPSQAGLETYDEFNQHLCMRGYIAAIHKLAGKELKSDTSDYSDEHQMPGWMSQLYEVMVGESVHLNVRLFIAKLVMSSRSIFGLYAKSWWIPIVGLINQSNDYGTGMNYYVQDLCLTLLGWSFGRDEAPNYGSMEEKLAEIRKAWGVSASDKINKLMETLVCLTPDAALPFMRNTVKIVEMFSSLFLGFYDLPMTGTTRLLKAEDMNAQLAGVFLLCAFAINCPEIVFSHDQFQETYEALINVTIQRKRTNSYINLLMAVAECVGKLLELCNALQQRGDDNEQVYETILGTSRAKIVALKNMQKHETDAVYFLYGATKSYPAIFDQKDVFWILSRKQFDSWHPDVRAKALEALVSYANEIPNMFTELKAFDILNILSRRDDECQLWALNLIMAIADQLTNAADVCYFLDVVVVVFPNHQSERCRHAYYSLLLRLHARFFGIVGSALVRGIADPDEVVRKMIVNYFDQKLPKDTIAVRLNAVYEQYSPNVEDVFLSFASSLLLLPTRITPDWESKIFTEGLDGAEFHGNVRTIDTQWTSTIMRPLFTMPPEQHEIVTDQEPATDPASQTLATPSRSVNLASLSNSPIGQATQSVSTDPLSSLRRRSVKPSQTGSIDALLASRKNKYQENFRREQREARRKQVTLLRSYRVGDLPDIEIKVQEIINPLIALAQRDADLSQILVPVLTGEVINKRGNEVGDFSLKFHQILEESPGTFLPLANSLLRIASKLPSESLNYGKIARLSRISSNQVAGIFVLENAVFEKQHKKRRKRGADEQDPREHEVAGLFDEIAELYKSIDFQDTQQSIYETFATSLPDVRDGLIMEANHDYLGARKVYAAAMGEVENASLDRLYLNVVEKLGFWDDFVAFLLKIDYVVQKSENDFDFEELFLAEKQEYYLPKFVKNVVRQELTPRLLDCFIKVVESDQNKRQSVEQICPYEFSVAQLKRRNLDQSRLALTQTFENFISSFPGINPLSWEVRANALSRLQLYVDLYDYDQNTRHISSPLAQDDIKRCLNHFNSRLPSATIETVDVWNDLTTGRCLALDELKYRLREGTQDPETENVLRLIEEQRERLLVEFGRAARLQHYDTLANKILTTIDSRNKDIASSSQYELAELYWARITRLTGEELASFCVQSFERIEDILKRPQPDRNYAALYARMCSDALDLSLHPETGDDFTRRLMNIDGFEVVFRNVETQQHLVQSLIDRAYGALRKSGDQISNQGENFGYLAEFCNRLIQQDSLTNYAIDLGPYALAMVDCVIKALQLGYISALQFVPSILRFAEDYVPVQKYFKKNSLQIPTWMYIRWLPQLTALMDHKDLGSAVFPILDAVATEYPAAVVHPLTISGQQIFMFKPDTDRNKSIYEQLMRKSSSEVMQRFILELKRIGEPYTMLEDFRKHVIGLLQSKHEHMKVALVNAVNELRQVMFDSRSQMMTKFLNAAGSALRDIIGVAGRDSPVLKMDLKTFAMKMERLLNSDKPPFRAHMTLQDIWRYLDNTSRISLRRPKKVDIIGSDERVYSWLVKAGEDLRLDQRVEQLFTVMNEIIAKDPASAREGMHVSTYKVVPMTHTLGIIEWIPNTMTIMGCLKTSKEFEEVERKALERYVKTLPKADNVMKQYGLQASQHRDPTIRNFKDAQRVLTQPYLRNFMKELCLTPEAFILLRNEFANSLAALDICLYLLGIGDRHLDNFLLDLRSGRLILIDFGYAFGTATEVLGVPELVPFRHTSAFEEVMEPLGAKGLMYTPMTRVLSAMQQSKESLLNAMDIFVKEPLVEWLSKSNKIARHKNMTDPESLQSSLTWYPNVKLRLAREKLQGYNPVRVMRQELEKNEGVVRAKFLNGYAKVLAGDKRFDKRAQVGEKCANAREQVECLMDLACDDNVKARMWAGWAPFI
ncbi:hypothetical protein SeMB42_g07198 [Synchytrium endobioticum]|uniref:DNA-dependent protein kinase catalytic subunit n=1 Tax=Synchytrium endobioticum TaxID=286115 RepID=A0A507C2M5_9FUNG|nr:hypothetical protein SeMB42_g07198 [Synchytrium endobioticum]